MRRWGLLALGLAVCLSERCGQSVAGGASETGNTGVGYVRVETFDAPPPEGVEHLNLRVTGLEMGDSTGWQALRASDTTIDFLALVGGVTALVADTSVPVGLYRELRVMVADTNEIIVSGVSYPLLVPSGAQSGIKVKLDLTVAEAESVTVYLDFNLSSLVSLGDRYLLRPSFHAFPATAAATVEGTVTDTAGAAVHKALVEAMGESDTLATLTAGNGRYRLVAPPGVYSLRCSSAGYGSTDTLYTGLVFSPGAVIDSLDFVLAVP